MSEDNKPTEVTVKVLTREQLERQIAASEQTIQQKRNQIINLTSEVEQQVGILKYSKHLLATFQLPEEEKAPLEVK